MIRNSFFLVMTITDSKYKGLDICQYVNILIIQTVLSSAQMRIGSLFDYNLFEYIIDDHER